MTEQKHTPGEWKFDERFDEVRSPMRTVAEIADADGIVWHCGLDSDECQANARLIAAAPELLEACQEALWEDCGLACAKQLKAAIKKSGVLTRSEECEQ